MWTFRLRLHMVDGGTIDLFGREEALDRFRTGLQALMSRGREDIACYLANNQARTIHVAQVERIGDLEPIIPLGALRSARSG